MNNHNKKIKTIIKNLLLDHFDVNYIKKICELDNNEFLEYQKDIIIEYINEKKNINYIKLNTDTNEEFIKQLMCNKN
jgi:hypothetical protein